jgi:23S rRNA pseudouridine1911/1915/1917 synthase
MQMTELKSPVPFHYSGPEILFEDNHLIAVNKRASDIVQADKTMDAPMTLTIMDYIKYTYKKPGNVFLGVVHRLDRPVSGVLLFTRTSKALARMNEMFKTREISKKYWALVKDPPPEAEGHLLHYIKKNERQNKSYVYTKEIKDSLLAELKYKLIGQSDRYFLIEVELFTGRHHQIRAQLASIGCPIKGDVKYGFDRPNKDLSIGLHARRLEFIHPIKKEPVLIIADPPADPVWDCFKRAVTD